MKDFKLSTTDHDLVLENGDLVLIKDDEEIAQSIKIRILFIELEWDLDVTMGTQWFSVLFNTNVPNTLKEQQLKTLILSTDGVIGISSFSFLVDGTNKKATVNFVADTIYGTAVGSASI